MIYKGKEEMSSSINNDDNPFAAYEVDHENIILENGKIPLIHWPKTPNFGDELSPWLIRKITGMETFQNATVKASYTSFGLIMKRILPSRVTRRITDKRARRNANKKASYISIGSIICLVRDKVIVWGTGSFGAEAPHQINRSAKYLAVRGPLTRALILDRGAKCPRVYGDPALLTPFFYPQRVEKTCEIGLVLRWSEDSWLSQSVGDGVTLINLGTSDVEGVLEKILNCKRIITSSLHGLIIADAYGISNAWLYSDSPKGREFKFYDYFLSVNKVRHSTVVDLSEIDLSVERLDELFTYDDRPIDFDINALIAACPFLKPKVR